MRPEDADALAYLLAGCFLLILIPLGIYIVWILPLRVLKTLQDLHTQSIQQTIHLVHLSDSLREQNKLLRSLLPPAPK